MASKVFSLDFPLPVLRALALISSGLHCPSSEYALDLLEAPCLYGAESQQAQRAEFLGICLSKGSPEP